MVSSSTQEEQVESSSSWRLSMAMRSNASWVERVVMSLVLVLMILVHHLLY